MAKKHPRDELTKKTNTTTTTTTTNTTENNNTDNIKRSRSSSNGKPSTTNNGEHESNPLQSISGFDEIGDGIIRLNDSKEIDFIASVKRVHQYMENYLKQTPQYHYELLSQLFKCDLELKLENLQLFGDIYVRNCFSILLSNYFNQAKDLKKEFREIGGFVLVVNPNDIESQPMITGSILTALHLKMKCIIYVAPGDLPLSQITRLYMCHARGAKVIFHKGDTQSCFTRAWQHAKDMSMVFIDIRFVPQFSLIGAATIAHEMYESSPDRETIIIPLRLYSQGWSYVSGVSLFYKIMKPDIKMIAVQMTDDLFGKDLEGKEYSRQSLFPDRLEIGWLALIHDQSDLTNVFDAFDSRNQGKFNDKDLQQILIDIGGDPIRNKSICPKSSLSQTEFVYEVITELTAGLNRLEEKFGYFLSQFKLENLIKHCIIDQLVTATEDQAAIAFVKCLEYTHTLTNGKGSIALGGLMSGNIDLRTDEKVLVMISGGFVDVIDFQTILNYGLDITGQSFEIELDLPDNTTSLNKVLNVIGENRVSVMEVLMDRSCETLKQYHVRTSIQCHSRNFEQQFKIFDIIRSMGFKYSVRKSAILNKEESGFLSPPMIKPNLNQSAASLPSISGPSIPLPIGSKPFHQQKRSINDITVQSIREAHDRIKHIMTQPPIYHSTTYSKICGCKVTLMLENTQKTGSFKIRGSSNMVLRAIEGAMVNNDEKPIGLVAASAGNHAQGVALISAKVGLPCTIVCPEYAPDSKLSSTRQYGAEVIKKGKSLEEAVKTADDICRERNWTLVRPYNDVDVIEGQGTMGCDIYDKVPDVDTVVVNVGGGGMIAGIALFLKRINPNIRIIGVQSANVSPLSEFKQTNQFRYIEPAVLSLADGTNVKMPGGVHTQVLHDMVDEYVTVSENEIASTIVHLLYNSRTVSEGAGCLGLAALMHHKIKVRKDEKVVVIICGGNIDMSTLRQVYEYGLRSLGRSFTIHLTTWDYPGTLSKIIGLAARAELKVREIRHIRGGGNINWNEVIISLSFYSNSFNHQNFFLSLLAQEGLFPKIVGRKYIKDSEVVYKIFDKAIDKKNKELKETFSERQKLFLEQYGRQANVSIEK
ncbi:threonine ammonia-lyase [Dictyostelium purpureum]|uniref:Threonine ammonia-lyase n=1 Tax=Dictyostelium purpureum TaxID=5786 RepID=F1A425_DICPU|nr:threonine ammonia-lyase [Dictyostelium purpureum]EGC29058.1 threonine ammonia-lyase [Dictyostelium purpureum]|eukprot:XP_003294419.1 threonine ammonia-lyase [Dictyostelium purpureum]